MDWGTALLGIAAIAAYLHLLNTAKAARKAVVAIVRLTVQSGTTDTTDRLLGQFATFTKMCPFIVTPLPGMEFQPCGLDGGKISKVIVDDQGLLVVCCGLNISPVGPDLEAIRGLLKEDGWQVSS